MTTLLNIEQDTESREPAQNGCPCPICQAPRPETEIYPLASQLTDNSSADGPTVLVSVSAADPFAFEGNSTGAFTVSRTTTVGDLIVPYTISGTATEGADFASLTGSVTIPDGSASATITIVPIDDGLEEAPETVTLEILGSAAIETDQAKATIRIRDQFTGTGGAVVPLDQTFQLDSLPGARHTIYLDFLGSNQAWNDWNSGRPIDTPAFSVDDDTTTFSDADLLAIQQAWKEIAEDFLPFEVNVTTVLPEEGRLVKTDASDKEWGVRAIFGDPTNWNEVGTGKAITGSFSDAADTPAWIRTNEYPGFIGAHEIGHTLGLSHDGNSGDKYYDGHGSGESFWGPIMGGPFEGVTQWDRGTYPGANNQEDDMAIISTQNGFGYRADDHADILSQASPLAARHISAVRFM